MPNYEKGEIGAFSQTQHLLNQAYKNADDLKKQRERDNNENPFTEIDTLVHLLTNLRT